MSVEPAVGGRGSMDMVPEIDPCADEASPDHKPSTQRTDKNKLPYIWQLVQVSMMFACPSLQRQTSLT